MEHWDEKFMGMDTEVVYGHAGDTPLIVTGVIVGFNEETEKVSVKLDGAAGHINEYHISLLNVLPPRLDARLLELLSTANVIRIEAGTAVSFVLTATEPMSRADCARAEDLMRLLGKQLPEADIRQPLILGHGWTLGAIVVEKTELKVEALEERYDSQRGGGVYEG